MDKATRLTTTFDGRLPDRPPILGGWLAAPAHVQTLTGCTDDDYWADPFYWGLEAERALGTDGVVTIFIPRKRGGYRCVDEEVLENRASYTMERVVAEIEALPDPDAFRDEWDETTAYPEFLDRLLTAQRRAGDILWCPASWDLIPKALWYARYGYERALMLPVEHPQHHLKLLRLSAEKGRQVATMRARAIREGLHPRAILTGEDLCGQKGPMISPAFLRREYFPLVEYTFEPLLAVGAKIVWHCDGDVRPILNDVFASGVAGLQGFQRECGMDVEWIVERRTRTGDPLLIFGPLSVTTTLPYGTPDDVRAEVRRAMALCRDQASLVFFTSNTMTPDVPLENILAFWDEVHASHW
ncbi:MAG: hypothetical protein HYY04_06295 [Chloroflexi bacterium]|nr:hypothetical protein [Chloroflexota bacterium]